MKKISLLVLFVSVGFFFLIYQSTNLSSFSQGKKPKNVILVIADGMGPASFTATRIWDKGSSGLLSMEKMPVTGYAKTYSGSDFVTDSAASGTALASGVKTYNGAIGLTYPRLDPKKKHRSLETLVDVMSRSGKSTGVLTTTRVTHATPASFYAHVVSRDMEDEIAEFVEPSSLDLLMGGGRRHFLPQDGTSGTRRYRKDGYNIVESLVKNGWTHFDTKQDMLAHKGKSMDSKVLGLFNDTHVTYEQDRSKEENQKEPSLTEMSSFAIEFLRDNKEGFFLMIEAGRIDHASHNNDVVNMLHETRELDHCIEMILNHELMDETLLVITADHETAGLAVSGYGDVEQVKGDELLKIRHQGTSQEASYLSWATGPNSRNNPDYPENAEKGYHLAPAAQYTEEANHTAVDVMVMASGVGASSFVGFMNNTEIPRRILSLVGQSFENPANRENPME